MEVNSLFLLRKFTFWLSLLSILICLNNYWGNDDKNILLIGLNPVLNYMVYKEPFRHWIFNFESAKLAADSSSIRLYYRVYLIHFFSFFLIGIIIDFVIRLVRRSKTFR